MSENVKKTAVLTALLDSAQSLRLEAIELEADKLKEQEPCQSGFDDYDGGDGRGAHIQRRHDRRQYRQWELNLKNKMRGRVR